MGAANKLYNGNIAETFWSTSTDRGFVRNYGYKYDNLNRLKDATYQKSGQVTGMYNENLSYDKNGNIMNLSRYGDRDEQYLPIQIDNLQYEYATNSNKLLNVADNSNNTSGFKDGNTTGDDYVYDANGNMTVDKNKNISSIVYNHLNLPTKIIFPTGNIVYFYNASGQKVQKVVTENTTVTTTDYFSGYQYKNLVLQYFPTVEGYVEPNLSSFKYVFQYKDHLGNVRLSYTKDTTGSLKILEESNYYPFGLKHNSYNVDNFQPDYKYKYNGKELQDELGLNMYDYGARFYDPAIGKFWQIDPMTEQSRRFSSYSYAVDNPVFFIDRDGMFADVLKSENDGECCPGFPMGRNSPKETSPLGSTTGNFTPSKKTSTLMNEATSLLSNVLGYEASASVGESVGVGATVGPVKASAEVTIIEVSAKTTEKNIAEVEMKGPGVKLSGAAGSKNGSASVTTGSGKVAMDKKGNISASDKGASGSASMGKDTKLSLSNSLTLAASVKIPTSDGVTVKAGVSVNLHNAGVGVAKLVEAGVSWMGDYVNNYFSN